MQTTDPTLRWSVARSFLTYVRTMADGSVDATDGARVDGDDVRFPIVAAREPHVLVATTGAVRCTGHHGMLALAFEAPRLETRGERLVLTLADADEQGGRLAFAELDGARLEGRTLVVPRPTLTRDGSDLFLGSYRPGMALDALEADLDVAATARVAAVLDTALAQGARA